MLIIQIFLHNAKLLKNFQIKVEKNEIDITPKVINNKDVKTDKKAENSTKEESNKKEKKKDKKEKKKKSSKKKKKVSYTLYNIQS